MSYSREQITLSGISSGTVIARKFGNVVSIQFFDITLSQSLANEAGIDIGTIPAKYRPPTSVLVLCITSDNTSTGKVRVAIDSNGIVNVKNRSGASIQTNVGMSCVVTYIVPS